MPDYRFSTVGPSEAGSNNQWAAFVADPFGDGSVSWTQEINVAAPGDPPDMQTVDADGVITHRLIDDNGQFRYDVRLYGPRAEDDIAAQFRVNGASGTRLTERRRPIFDVDGNVIGDEVYESGELTTRQWRSILLITGPDNEEELDPETGQPTGRPSSWPPELEEHRWL